MSATWLMWIWLRVNQVAFNKAERGNVFGFISAIISTFCFFFASPVGGGGVSGHPIHPSNLPLISTKMLFCNYHKELVHNKEQAGATNSQGHSWYESCCKKLCAFGTTRITGTPHHLTIWSRFGAQYNTHRYPRKKPACCRTCNMHHFVSVSLKANNIARTNHLKEK